MLNFASQVKLYRSQHSGNTQTGTLNPDAAYAGRR